MVYLLYPILVISSRLYWIVTVIRNAIYDLKSSWANGLTVISLGNLSSGGTGKTPVGLAMIRDLKARQVKVSVVMRGYGKKEGLSDEAELYRQVLSVSEVLETPDRRQGLAKVKQNGAEFVILDDAFQHRRVARQADVVLIDATRPPWEDHLLPWGFLREGESALKRAHAVILTRSEQVDHVVLEKMKVRLSRHVAPTHIFSAQTKVMGWLDLQGHSCEARKKAYLVSAIGNPENFLKTVQQSGCAVVGFRWFVDHHHFSTEEMAECSAQAKALGAVILMTSKDAVKWSQGTDEVYVLSIGIDLPWDDLWHQLGLSNRWNECY